ncbi:mannose-6-phosphate isomerase [Lentibacillus halodurans]|uniref:Mannose-6-phosphate isomerase n=1 Tax=Lentibacillus halodurans TaxID=237679 RepID=A0A1I0YCL9_9BACI|nr:mannose-6-phosphate isomerase, class I [Lentibacillus halodurans]SFB11011.1 mannose-6-phosphate isomerase [Lentibacillus halodurans]
MYNEPIFLQPAFQEKIWGGDKLKIVYNYDIPSERTGEAWVISAHPNGPSVIENGPLKGKTLADAWESHGELFNKTADHKEAYPLLVKMLDANDDLSVQVHPDDQFAQKVESVPYGKTECWYVLDAEPEAEIVFGHHAETKEQLTRMMNNGEWDELLRRVRVQSGDFVYVPSGTIHAIGGGIVILETQQSSDTTYRVYDYDRTDVDGNKRGLHLDKAAAVTNVPHQMPELNQEESVSGGLTMTKLVENDYFRVSQWTLNGDAEQMMEADFLQISAIKGNATLTTNGKSFEIEKGTNFILPHGVGKYALSGKAEFVVSWA